jgi:AraC family transcriptional regulator, positive regulator of tynA and feaB
VKPLFSTETVHPRDRLAYWREEATKAFVTHEFSTPLKHNFSGEVCVGALGDVGVAEFRTDQAEVNRTGRCLRAAEDDDALLIRQIDGGVTVHQDARDVRTYPGDVYILDPRRTFTLVVPANTHALVFKVPRAELQGRLGEISSFTARPLSRGGSVAGLASEFLAMLASCTDAIDRTNSAKLAQQALDLVALAFRPKDALVRLSSGKAAVLLRLKSIIEDRLCDPQLKPGAAAAAAGISVRYANALLADEDTSLERYIILRRLHRCNEILLNATQRSRTVSDIAYSCGFTDLSHFSRRYKAHFGFSPKEGRPTLD